MEHGLFLLCWFLLFIFCNLGYWEFFQKKLNVDAAFYPSLSVVWTITALYLAGILNFLREASLAVWLFGLLYLCKRIWEERSVKFLRFYCKPAFFMLALFAAVFFAACYGKVLVEYDNFTHWGLVVKQMVTENHFPDYRDNVILFQAYPLGTAIYLYFGLSFPGIGMAEDMAMFLQSYMMVCFIVALFSRGKKNLTLVSVFVFIAMVFSVSVSLGILDLRVDVVLGIATGCTLLYVYDYCLEKAGSPEFWMGACYMTALSQIKNSAMLMVLICSGGILREIRRDRKCVQRITLAASPLAAWFLWRKHYGSVYPAAANSYHAMTLSNYKKIFFDNPISLIGRITLELLRFAFTFRKTIFCALCFLVVTLLVLRIWKQDVLLLKRAVVFSVCFYCTYMFFLLAMYIFSMGTVESKGLPSAARYTNTALLVINYILCAVCVRLLSKADLRDKRQLASTVVLLLLLPCRMLMCGEKPISLHIGKTEDPLRQEMSTLILENQIPSDSQYCLIVPADDNGLLNFKLRYSLMSGNVRQISGAEETDLKTITEPYIFVYDSSNPAVQNWLKNSAGNSAVVLIPQSTTE